MAVLLTFLSALFICLVVYAFGTMFAALLFRLPMEEVSLCYGPTLVRLQIGETTFRLKCLPFGAFVKLKRDAYEPAPLHGRILLLFSGHGCVFLAAVFCLGFELASGFCLTSFEQFLRGALHPLSEGRDYVKAAIEYLSDHKFFENLGTVAAKNAALNFIPIPPLSGGIAVLTVVELIFPMSDDARDRLCTIPCLVLLGAVVSWIVAVAAALRS